MHDLDLVLCFRRVEAGEEGLVEGRNGADELRAADFVDGECGLSELPQLFRQMTAGNHAVKTLVHTGK